MQWVFPKSKVYPEALLHPEVNQLDEGFSSLSLTLAQCPSIQQSALVTKLSEALLLDVVNLLTLRVISILSVCASWNPTGSNFTWRGWFTDAWGYITSISLCQSKSIRKQFYLTWLFHWRLGLFYSISLRQSKSIRKQFHFRLKHSLVLRFYVPNAHGLS